MTETKICPACRSGVHAECDLIFAGLLAEAQECCCEGEFTLDDLELLAKGTTQRTETPPTIREPVDSGYIHPRIFRFKRSIGTFVDPASTGRKLADRLYKIKPGMVCEWAGKKNCGGGNEPIVGCLNNPASELHHGPDKNTLNNAKMSWAPADDPEALGDTENIHIVCAFCHNRWHALNDPTYPKGPKGAKYDRVANQHLPYVPLGEKWTLHDPQPATREELMAEDQRRYDTGIAKGGRAGGRGAKGAGAAEDVDDVDEDEG